MFSEYFLLIFKTTFFRAPLELFSGAISSILNINMLLGGKPAGQQPNNSYNIVGWLLLRDEDILRSIVFVPQWFFSDERCFEMFRGLFGDYVLLWCT